MLPIFGSFDQARSQRVTFDISADHIKMLAALNWEALELRWVYEPLTVEIIRYFKTGKPPVSAEETLEIFAFMEAADESKRQGGGLVTLESVMQKAWQVAVGE